MAYKIDDIEGIGPSYAGKLATAGVKTTDDLLERCRNAHGRKNVARQTKIGEKVLLGWANQADLMRIPGIGPQFAELLVAAGVDTVKELGTRNSENLRAKMAELNRERKLARSTPAESFVAGWVSAAKHLDAVITH